MKRRILALCLTVCMVLGMLPPTALAQETPEPVTTHPAAFATATVDGAANEAGWALSGKLDGGTPFGFTWDKENLYLAVKAVEGKQLSATINGQSVNTAGAVTGSVVELAIPLDSIGVKVDSYDVSVDASITYGEETWEGKIAFDPNVRVTPDVAASGAAVAAGHADNTGIESSNGSYHYWSRYNAESTAEGANTTGGLAFALNNNLAALQTTGKAMVLDFDFRADALPVVAPTGYRNTGVPGGMILAVFNVEKRGFDIAIINTAEGLTFCVNDAANMTFHTALIGKELEETFHVRLHLDLDNTLCLYVDDVLVETFENTTINAAKWTGAASSIRMDMETNALTLNADGSNDADFTVSDMRLGFIDTPNPLDSLTFDTIKGDNASAEAVENNLVLPTVISNNMLTDAVVTWSSSEPAVVSNKGKVTPAAVEKTVTLTASAASFTKEFTVTVPAGPSTHPAAFTTATVDGAANEEGWALSGKLDGGTPFGFTWDKENLYLAVKAVEGKQLSATINGQSVNTAGAVAGSVVELAIPLDSIGVKVNSYDVTVGANITYGEESWSGRIAFDPNVRDVIPDLSGIVGPTATENLGGSYSNGVYRQWNRYVEGGANNSGGRAYAVEMTEDLLETGKTKVIDFDFYSENMPIAKLGVANYGYANCYGMSMTVGLGAKEDNGYNNERLGFVFGIANTSDGLVLCVLTGDGSVPAFESVPLGKQEKEAFHMRFEYDTNDNLTAYVDDVLVGAFENVFVRDGDVAFASAIWLNLFTQGGVSLTADGENDTDYTVSNLRVGTLETPNPLDSLTFDTIKGRNEAEDAVYSNLVLPAEISTDMLSGVKLQWSSSNPAVISNTGVVTSPETATEVTLTAALVSDPSVTKRFNVTVEAASVVHPAAFATATVDGAANEEGWALSGKLDSGTPFGFTWDKENLYLAVKAVEGKQLSATINGQSVNTAGAVAGSVVELAIPLDSIGVKVNSYDVTVGANVTYGEESWSGRIAFDPNVRVTPDVAASGAAVAVGHADNTGITTTNGVYHYWSRYNAESTAEGANTTGGLAYALNNNLAALQTTGKAMVLDFDFRADALPVVAPTGFRNTGVPGGMILAMYNVEKRGFDIAIINTAEGLTFCVNDAANMTFHKALIGKELEETFHVRLHLDLDNTLCLYVDDVLVETFENTTINAAKWSGAASSIRMDMETNALTLNADGSNDADFTVSNVRLGFIDTPNPLDSLTFDTIKGSNEAANAVYNNLVLPSEFSTSMLSGLQIKWSSSNPAVISNTGVVTSPETATEVTLTAALVSDPAVTKSITVTVEESSVVHPAAFAEGIDVNGELTEVGWALSGKLDGKTPFGFTWDKENLYLAIQSSAGSDLTVNINGYDVAVAGKQVGTATELAIPLSSIGVTVNSYDLRVKASITYGEESWSGKLAFDPNARNMIPNLGGTCGIVNGTAENLGYDFTDGSYRMWNKYNSSATDGESNKTGGAVYALQLNNIFKGINKTKVIEFDFRADKLPVVTPSNQISISSAGGYGMAITLFNGGTDFAKSGFTAGIARTADGLVLHAFDGAWALKQIPLDKELGETFHVRLEYSTEGDLVVYVDDVYLTTISSALLRPNDWGASNGGSLRLDLSAGSKDKGVTLTADGENDMDFTLSNVRVGTKETGSVMEGLTFEQIKGTNKTADTIRTNLYLPTELPHNMLSGIGISWSSSNTALISNSGVVTNPAAATQVVLTASLNSNPAVTKEFVVTVLPFAVETLYHDGAVTVDGTLEENVWMVWNTLSDGSQISSVWNKGKAYFAIKTEAETVALTLNKNYTLTVNMADGSFSGITGEGVEVKTSEGVAEIAIPHSAFGIRLTDFNQTASVAVELDGVVTMSSGAAMIFSGRTTVDTVEYTTIAGVLSKDELFGLTDLMHVRENLTLKKVVETEFFEPFELVWKTSDANVITDEGVITRHATDYGHATVTLSFNGNDLWSVDVTVDPLSAKEHGSSSKVSIGFAGQGIIVNGSIRNEDWVMATRLMNSAGDAVIGEMGALWNEENLYLAIRGSGALTLKVNDVTITTENATIATSGEYREVSIPLSVIDAANASYGDTIEVDVTVGEGSWKGTLTLTSTDWWMVGNRVDRMPVPDNLVNSVEYRGGGAPTKNQGATEVENGWHIYDLYDPNGNNPTTVRTYVIFQGAGYEGFDDRTGGIQFEFDFEAVSMPVYEVGHDSRSSGYSNYGITWSISDKARSDKYSNVILGGIYNTKDGLYLVSKGSLREDVKLNKSVGDKFHVGLTWHADGTFDVFIDGELLVSYAQMDTPMHAIGNCSFVINSLGNPVTPEKPEDSVDVYMTNLAFGKVYSEGGLGQLSFDTIRGDNETQDNITSDLNLPKKVSNGQLVEDMTLTWTSSNPDVINPDTGKVNVPASGAAIIKLTVSDRYGNSKSFDLIVPGSANDNTGKLVVTKDLNPANSSGNTWDPVLFTLDANNNSVILDNGEVKPFTSVVLRDGDAFARLNRESLTLWVSDDNVTYTQIKDYKLLHQGECWYLYDFTANARYVKVHYTHFDGADSDFVGALSTMIAVGDGDFGKNDGTWTTTANVTLTNNSGSKWQDKAVTIPGVTGDASVRVLLNGKYLYHYMDGTDIIVRIPDLAAGASAELQILTGNEDALDISNKEAVYEVTYGTRETYNIAGRAWITSLKAGAPLPGGGTVERDMVLRMDHQYIDASYDGGITWSRYSSLPQEIRDVAYGDAGSWADGGFIYDSNTGRIFYQMIVDNVTFDGGSMENNDSYIAVIYSDDAGINWALADILEPDVIDGKPMNYCISYNDGIMLSSYDGAGENVDFVFTVGAQYDVGAIFCTRVAYSTDGGFTWQYSNNLMIAEGATDFEDGLSESSILENEDGVLVLYSRNQVKNAVTFAKCYSYDKGITWTSGVDTDSTDADVLAEQSTVYSGPTEAVMQYWDFSDFGGNEKTPMMVWGGNNAEGGTSYMRAPLSIAVSYDGLENFRNIQNLYLETFMEAFSDKGKWRTTNPAAAQFGDSMVVVFDSNDIDGDGANNQVQMIVSDFDNWFYRTKGIYDAFENGSVKYEGWSMVKGSAEQSKTDFTDGYAMKLSGETIVTRSIPYFQNGTISMDIYFTGDPFALELQSAYTATLNRAAPVGINVAADGTVTFTGSDAATGLTLQSGWNTVTFELKLTEDKAEVSVNGGEAKQMHVNVSAGDYVCYLTFNAHGVVYVDEVLAESDLDAVVYTAEIREVKPIDNLEATLSLNDEVCYNFYFSTSEELAGVPLSDMGLLAWSSEPADPSYDNAEKRYVGAVAGIGMFEGKNKVTTSGIAAKNMAEDQYFCIYAKKSDGTYVYSKVFQYSAKRYAQNKISDSSTDPDLVKTCIALLNYGAEAQKYFAALPNSGYSYDVLMNAELTEEQQQINYERSMIAALDAVDASKSGVFAATAGAFVKKEATVSLGGALGTNYYFTSSENVDSMKMYYWTKADYDKAEVLTTTNATNMVEMIDQGGNKFKGAVTGIAAKDFDETMYVCGVYEINGVSYSTGIIAYSAGQYCANKAAATGNAQMLVQATAVYCYYAKVFLAKQ